MLQKNRLFSSRPKSRRRGNKNRSDEDESNTSESVDENDYSSAADLNSKGRFDSKEKKYSSNDQDHRLGSGSHSSNDKTTKPTDFGSVKIPISNEPRMKLSTNERNQRDSNIAKSSMFFPDAMRDSLFQMNAKKNKMISSKSGLENERNKDHGHQQTRQGFNTLLPNYQNQDFPYSQKRIQSGTLQQQSVPFIFKPEKQIPPSPLHAEDDPKMAISQLGSILEQRLDIELPVEELNIARIQTSISLNLAEDRVSDFEHKVERAQKEVEKLENSMAKIVEKSTVLDQTAQVVTQKLAALNEWADTIDSTQTNIAASLIGWFLWLFSLLEAILTFVWGGLRISFSKNKENEEKLENEEQENDSKSKNKTQNENKESKSKDN